MFKTLMLTALLPCLSGGTIQNQPSYLSKNDDDYEITLSAQESFKSLLNFYNDFLEGNFESISLRYENSVYVYNEILEESIDYISDDTYISFVLDTSDYLETGYNYYFVFSDGNDYSSLNSDLVIQFDDSQLITEELFNVAYEALKEDLNIEPSYTNILQEIITILVSGITGIATGLGNGVSQLVSSIFITNGNLSIFGGVVIAFAGLGLAVGLSRWVMNFLTSLGKKD